MATSADKLATIISKLSEKYNFSEDRAILFLAKQELLPKKLLPKQNQGDSVWASKKAQELAEQHGIEAKGDGSGKNGKWTLADVEKAMQTPAKQKLLVSPNALNLANEHKISLVGKVGTGKDGRILLKDVEAMIAKKQHDEEEEELEISPRALQEANELGITNDELTNIQGSGKDGRILLSDIKTYSSDKSDKSDKSDSEDED